MTATAISNRPAPILRPFAIMAISAFMIGFLAVMAATGVAVLAQLGEFATRPRCKRRGRPGGCEPRKLRLGLQGLEFPQGDLDFQPPRATNQPLRNPACALP